MDTFWIVSIAANAVLGLAGFLMKYTIDDLKNQASTNRRDIDYIKEKYFKREDFVDFKEELWRRLDRFEKDVKDQLNGKQ